MLPAPYVALTASKVFGAGELLACVSLIAPITGGAVTGGVVLAMFFIGDRLTMAGGQRSGL